MDFHKKKCFKVNCRPKNALHLKRRNWRKGGKETLFTTWLIDPLLWTGVNWISWNNNSATFCFIISNLSKEEIMEKLHRYNKANNKHIDGMWWWRHLHTCIFGHISTYCIYWPIAYWRNLLFYLLCFTKRRNYGNTNGAVIMKQ